MVMKGAHRLMRPLFAQVMRKASLEDGNMPRMPRNHAFTVCLQRVDRGLIFKTLRNVYPKSISSSRQPFESAKPQDFEAQTAALLSILILGYTFRIVLFR